MNKIPRYEEGDIVYWVDKIGWEPVVKWGRVSEQIGDMVYVDYLIAPDPRTINGVPVGDIEFPTKWSKLPKGWTYDFELFHLGWNNYNPDNAMINIDKPKDIAKAFDKGLLIFRSNYDDCAFESEIDKNHGWRIVKRYDRHRPAYATIEANKLYTNYADANAEKESIIKEFERQASLSDEEWSIEQITKTVNYWQHLYGKTDLNRQKVLDYLLSKDKVVDIETRIFDGNVQWKKCKNKRWNIIGGEIYG